MKKITSISLGSSKRNHRAEVEILNENFIIDRIGTDGDMKKAMDLLKHFDGKVDAFGMGGIDLYIYVGKNKYEIREAKKLKEIPKITPIVDGSGLKNTLERRVIGYLDRQRIINFKDKKVLLVSAADRFGMAEALELVGCELTCGDLMFSLGIPYPIRSLTRFYRIANALAPLAVKLPFKMLYPIGGDQNLRRDQKYREYYLKADIIAGDYHYIKKYMPRDMGGKTVITNTITQEDIKEMKEKGIDLLVTTTPELNGRSFGTNVLEAVFMSILQHRSASVGEKEYFELLEKLQLKPRILHLNTPTAYY